MTDQELEQLADALFPKILARFGKDPGEGNTNNIHKNYMYVVSDTEGAAILKQWQASPATPPVVTTPAPAPTPTVAKPVADPGKYDTTLSNSIKLYGKPDGAIYDWRYIEGPGFDGWWNNSNKSQAPTMLGLKNGLHKVGLTVTMNGVKSDEVPTPITKK